MIRLFVDNYDTRVFSDDTELLSYVDKLLYDKLSVKHNKNRYIPRPIQRMYRERIYFYNQKTHSFLSGFLDIVKQILSQSSISYEVVPTYQFIAPKFLTPSMTLVSKVSDESFHLRNYQIEAIMNVSKGKNRGVFSMATNSGKTLMCIALVNMIGRKTLFLVDRTELFIQAKRLFSTFCNYDVGSIAHNIFSPAFVTICMQKTLYSRIKADPKGTLSFLREINVVIIDECHKCHSRTWRYVISKLRNAYYRFGLSGTPYHSESVRNAFILGLLGPTIYRVKNSELIEQGYSAKPVIYMVRYNNTIQVVKGQEYSELYKDAIVYNQNRNNAIVNIIYENADKTVLVIVRSIDHGRIIFDMLDSSRYFVYGGSEKSDRIDVYNKLKDKKASLVIATLIYKEGIDLDSIDVIVYAVGEKAPITILQTLGRGLRIRKDKSMLKFYDFVDDMCGIMRYHTRLRTRLYEKEGFDVFRVSI